MLCFIVGKDRVRIQQKIHERVKGVNVQMHEATELSFSQLYEMSNTRSLFGETYTYVLQNIHEVEEIENKIFNTIESIHASGHTFVCTTSRLLKKQKECIEKYEITVDEFITTAKKEVSSFILSDAFFDRNKKRAWIAVCEELKTKSPEGVHGGLWHNVKSILLVQSGATQIELGLPPFVYTKIKKAEKLFDGATLALLAQELLHMPQRAHRGKSDFATELEQWVLKWTT